MARLQLSLNERLLIHLWEMERHKDEADLPVGVSQEGISQRLGTGVHTISRLLSTMVGEGTVSERLAHVRGAQKRRKVYFLTPAGLNAVQSLRIDISSRKIVLEHQGKAQELTFEEAMRRIGVITGAAPGFLEMVELASAVDAIRTDSLPRHEPPSKSGPEFLEWSQGRPKVESFFGREPERKMLQEMLDGAGASIVLIWGMPGIGKSTLASKVFDELSGRRMLFWYSFREWDTESSFLSSLSEFMTSASRGAAAAAVRRGAAPAELFMPLVTDLSSCRAVLFLDDIQKCSRQVFSVLSMATEAVRSSGSSKAVLISRSVPGFFSTVASGNTALELAGLDRDSAWRMAQSMSARDALRVVDESRGHPLLLTLMSRGGPGATKGDVSSFIEREIYSTITEDERTVLEALSMFRHPVPMDALPDIDNSVVMGLKNRALVVEQEGGIWVHDLLREFFSSHLGPEARKSHHLLAAAYCDKNPAAEWKLEALYHLVGAEAWAESRRVALANAAELAADFPEETLALITRIPTDDAVSHRENAELMFMRGQLHEQVGKEETALADFERSLSLLESEEDVPKRALVLEAQARLQSEVRRWSEALSDHEKALHIYEKAGDSAGQTREWLSIGGVLRRKGDLAKARKAYETALALATKHEDRPSEAACLNNIGLLDRDEGRLRDAEAKLKESVRLAHAVKDSSGEARGLENLAELYRIELRASEMTSLLRESSEAFRRAGEIQEFKRLQAASAEAMGEQGYKPEAIRLVLNALENPDVRKPKGLFQRSPRFDQGDLALSESLIGLLRSSNEPKRAQRELVRFYEIAASIGDKEAVARGRLLRAMVHEDLGELDLAAESLREAEEILRSAGSSDGLIAVHMRRGALEARRGDVKTAADHYREAARQAEKTGNEFGRVLAIERLEGLKKRPHSKEPAGPR